MACFTLITFNRYDAHQSKRDTFDVPDTHVTLALFKSCIAEVMDIDDDRDEFYQHIDDQQPVHNQRTDMIGMDEDEVSYLFFMS